MRAILLCGAAACYALAGCGVGSGRPALGGGSSSAGGSTLSTGPQLGYVWDSSAQSLRATLGVPGSSQIGAAVSATGYIAGAASPRIAVAVLQAKDGSLEAQPLPNGSAVVLGGVTVPVGARIVFSPSGSSALAYAPGSTKMALITGLSTSPQAQQVNAPAQLQGAAVSDTALVAVVSGSGTLQLSLLGGTRALATLGGYGGVNFLPGADTLLAADSAANTITLIQKSSTSPAAQTFTSAILKTPVDVNASQDGRWALAANAGDASLARIDLTGQTAAVRIPCTCQPNQLAALNGNAVFRITSFAAGGPTWIVNAAATAPKTLFIPAAPAISSAGGQQ